MKLILSVILLIIISCSNDNELKPVDIHYGQDICERCKMIISEEKFSSQIIQQDGTVYNFDDIGGMLAYITEESEDVASYWVHDFVSGEWIRAEEATFLLDSDLMTPMGFGIAAFADEAQAQALGHGHEGVMIMPFAQILAMDITMPVAHMNDMDETEHMHE